MREILFRGKRLDGGEWVCGNSIIMLNNPEADKPYDIAIFDEHWQLWQTVEPETVGQYTGLKDKNGKKIFEGDICGCFCKTQIFEVKYCDDRCGYFFDECVTSGGCKPAPECLGNLRNTIEVIGNIHDNPELLDENLDKIHRKATEKMLAYSNKEKYAKEIIEAAIRAERIGVNKYTAEIKDCYEMSCGDCLFSRIREDGTCVGALKEWANAECEE